MPVCEICHDLGLVRTEKGTARCSCQVGAESAARIRRAGFPPEFESASFDNFEKTEHNAAAAVFVRRFAEDFLPGKPSEGHPGLLLHGTIGMGKTHLAVATGRLLIASKGTAVRFVDTRELYHRLKASFDEKSKERQSEIIQELLETDLTILDDLGAVRTTEWVCEVTELLIGSLYNRRKSLIVTTNLANLSPGEGESDYDHLRPPTLGDRIGARMWSRLQQMCTPVRMVGPDWRTGKRR